MSASMRPGMKLCTIADLFMEILLRMHNGSTLFQACKGARG